MDIEDSVRDYRQKYDVPGKTAPERCHPVQNQRFLCLVQIESRCEANTEDDISLDRVFFLSNELVPIVFGNVRSKEDVLLKNFFFLEFGPHEI